MRLPRWHPPRSILQQDAGAVGAIGCVVVATLALLAVLVAVLIPMTFMSLSPPSSCDNPGLVGGQPSPGGDAQAIPATYLQLYQKAGEEYGLPWTLLAGVGKVESGHGTSNEPGVHSGENYAGAGGPMQFLASTWNSFGVDGNQDGRADRYDPADAIPGAARYLQHSGAPERTRTALYAYNHSWGYVNLVLAWAKRYGGARALPTVDPAGVPQDNCGAPGLGSIPASGLVGRIIAFAMAQRGKPYVFGAAGPDAWDCSSLIQAAYRSVGIRIPRTTFEQWPFGIRIPKGAEQAGDLVFFNSGPGTSTGNPGHVGLVIDPQAGTMIVARCSSCIPAIGVQNYKTRSDWIGATRPLARPDIRQKINSVDRAPAALAGSPSAR
ncbi:C40 family peptidase [Actinomadura sp. 3N407]|uniref:C40 family peptidase n=1 Tax=Actinomadura sp. 3N407 TaxID=3457423 RepID=UPI003FCEBA3A